MRKKYKVVDSVFFNGEIDYLLFRLTEMSDVIDYFIILEEEKESSLYENNLEKFEPWKEKIIHIKSEYPSEEKINFMIEKHDLKVETNNKIVPLKLSQIYDLSNFLDRINLGFDDIILLSNADELPILPELEVLQSFLSFEPVVFSQKNFLWNKDFIKHDSHLGTLCFQYSHFVTNKNISLLFTENEVRNISLNFTPIESGYKFELFKSVEDSVNYICSKYGYTDFEKITSFVIDSRTNLISYDFEKLSKSNLLVKYHGILPKHISMLQSQQVGRITPKKHLVIVGIDSSRDVDFKDFDSVSIISNTSEITRPYFVDVSENAKLYYIQIPKEKYYDVLIDENNLKNFQKMFFLNEIKKVLVSHHPLDFDIFEFRVGGKVKYYSWSQIQNEFLYDLLN